MLIDRNTPAVAALLTEWQTAPRTRESSEQFKSRLAMDILKPAIRPFVGQLMLFSHKFLTMVPTGTHSFAHGTEMRSKDIHWLTAGRIDSNRPPWIFPMQTRGAYIVQPPGKKPEIVPYSSEGMEDYFIPVRWFWRTQMRYRRGTNHPHFIMHEQGPLYEPEQSYIPVPAIDISAFGDHLFRLHNREHDWATNISLIIGTRGVKAYLADNKSLAAFNRIARL
jgi:hypothetical protein